MFKDKETKIIVFISILILIMPIMLILLLYKTILSSSGTGPLVKSDYVGILNSILTAFIGLVGNFLTVVGAYFIFKKERDGEKSSNEELKKYHIENIAKILVESVNNTESFVTSVCINHTVYSEDVEFPDIYRRLKRDILLSMHTIALYPQDNEDYNKDLYISNMLDAEVRLVKKNYTYRYEDVSKYFTIRDRDSIREWLNIVNTDKFENLIELHDYLLCRDHIVSIIKEMDDIYKEEIHDFLLKDIKDTRDTYEEYKKCNLNKKSS